MLYVCFLFARLNSTVSKSHLAAVTRKALYSDIYIPSPYTFTCKADQKLEKLLIIWAAFSVLLHFHKNKTKKKMQNYTGNVLNLKLVAENFKNN